MIKELIYKYLEEENLKKEKKEYSGEINFAPSYLTDCKRKTFYKKLNYPKSNPIETHTMLKFDLGNITHELIQKYCKNSNDVIWLEGEDWKSIKYNDLYWIYRIDNMLKVNYKKYILEVKSTYFSGWKSVESEPKKEHILQLYIYMIFENIDNGILLYIGRDNGLIAEYEFNIKILNDLYLKEVEEIINKLKILKSMIENKELPERDFKAVLKLNDAISWEFQKDKIKYITEWQCNYCQWKNYCWSEIAKKMNDERYKYYIDGNFIKE